VRDIGQYSNRQRNYAAEHNPDPGTSLEKFRIPQRTTDLVLPTKKQQYQNLSRLVLEPGTVC